MIVLIFAKLQRNYLFVLNDKNLKKRGDANSLYRAVRQVIPTIVQTEFQAAGNLEDVRHSKQDLCMSRT